MTSNITYDWSSNHLLDAELSAVRFTINISPETPRGFIRWYGANPKVTLDVTRLPHLWDLPERMECSLRTELPGLIELPRQKSIQRLFITQASAIHAPRLEEASHIVIPMAGIFEAFKLEKLYSFVAHNLHARTVDELIQLGAKNVTSSHKVSGAKIGRLERPQTHAPKGRRLVATPFLA